MHWFLICCRGDDIFSWEVGMRPASNFASLWHPSITCFPIWGWSNCLIIVALGFSGHDMISLFWKGSIVPLCLRSTNNLLQSEVGHGGFQIWEFFPMLATLFYLFPGKVTNPVAQNVSCFWKLPLKVANFQLRMGAVHLFSLSTNR